MTDGLGNRLFQMTAAISVGEALKRNVVILLPAYLKTGHDEYDLIFQLYPNIPIVESASSWIQVDEKLEIPENNSGQGIVLKGYFQNTNYFPRESSLNSLGEKTELKILSFPNWKHPLLPKLPEKLLKPFNKKVAVHFRFGDYTFLQHHQVPLEYYYMKALNKFPVGTEFLLFSDSPEKLVKIQEELCKKGYKVSIANGKGVLETLLEIASCSGGFIGANSTFSWWASYLSWKAQNFSKDYVAYFPDTWMGSNKPNLFTLPFTKSLTLDGESPSKLESFSYK